VFEMTVLHRIRGVTRRDPGRNVDVWKELGVTGDVVNEVRQQMTLVFQSHGPHVAYGLREDFKIAGVTLREAEYMARDRRLWSRTVYRRLERVDQSAASATPTH